MSYAGTYQPCPHDAYARNCRECLWENGGKQRYKRELPHRLAHPADARNITVKKEEITVFSASCPNPLCSWSWSLVHSRKELQRRIDLHIQECERTAAEWSYPCQS